MPLNLVASSGSTIPHDMVPGALVEELEAVIGKKDVRRQAEVMRRVADLFVAAGCGFSDDHVAMFDDVMSRLVAVIDSSVRATFGDRFASLPNAPPKTIRTLALDDTIEVAGPVLSRSERLDDASLVETAKTKSQDHLLAISRRQTLAEVVTDVLVERGNQQVVRSTATNAGAKFSDFGCSTLALRSKEDGELALHVWARSDIPRQHLLTLFVNASEVVRNQLQAADRSKAELYRYMVAQATNQVQTRAREASPTYIAARAYVLSLHQAGALAEEQLNSFAAADKFDEVTIALSLMCNLPIEAVERAVAQGEVDQVLVLAKAVGLSWETVASILMMPANRGNCSKEDLDRHRLTFARLQTKTAKAALQFYGLRVRATKAMSN
jgi:uncharacterized protein (DUF2336 family)